VRGIEKNRHVTVTMSKELVAHISPVSVGECCWSSGSLILYVNDSQ